MKIEVWGAQDGRCPQCNTLKKFLDSKFATYGFMCVDKYPETRKELGIKNIPVMILRDDDGTELERVVGFNENTRHKVLEIISK